MSSAQELQDRGVKLFQQRDYEAAALAFQQAHDAYSAEGKRDLAAEMQTNLGLVHRELGEHQKALENMQSALEVFQGLEDPLRVAKVLGNMGPVYSGMGDKEQAYNCYRQAADVFQELGEDALYRETMRAMAALQMRDGKIMAAAATYEVGLENVDQLTPSQRVLKGLIGIRNKLTGGGTAPNENK